MKISKRFIKIVFKFFKSAIEADSKLFYKKNILLIGPANTLIEELNEINIEDYDLIVRMNRAIEMPIEIDGKNTRVDVLFHNFKENGARGAGKINRANLKKSEINTIIFPGGSEDRFKPYILGLIKYRLKLIRCFIWMTPSETYSNCMNALSGYSPTTGYVAIKFLSECDFETLNIIGFTFFQTRYVEGYNNDLKNDEDGLKWAGKNEIHNPTLEAKSMLMLIKTLKENGKNIKLGKGVTNSLKDNFD